MLTVEEPTHRFANASVFSKVDAKHGYWSIALDDQSQHPTTYNSPFGRYCFRRLSFGLNVSQDLFPIAMDDVLDGFPSVISITDDIVVYRSTPQEHSEVDEPSNPCS